MTQPGQKYCPEDGHELQFVRDLTTDDDEPECAAQCPLCDRFYWVRTRHRELVFETVGRTASLNARRRKEHQAEADE